LLFYKQKSLTAANWNGNEIFVAIKNAYHLESRGMYVCLCRAVTDADIRQAADAGVADVNQLVETLGVGANCGACLEAAQSIMKARLAGQLAYAA